MAPHTRFKLAIIRTMRCDFCNKSNVDGLQECVDCNMHICRGCVETGKLNKDEKHRMEQNMIDNLDWKKVPRARRATHRRTSSGSEPNSSPPAVASNQERRQARVERRQQLQQQSDHDNVTYYESGPPFRNIRPRPPQNMNMFSGGEFNISPGNHGHLSDVYGHGHFPFGSARPGMHNGHNPSFPTHMMPPGMLPFVPSQPGQPPNQGGLAMPMGPMFGHHFTVNPGPPPRGDPRLDTPPGPQFAHSGYPVPNNFGGFQGGQPLAFSPAPTPPGFAGPGFHHLAPQQPHGVYNERGYVPQGNMPPGQPMPGPFPFTGPPYGAGPFSYAPQPPPQQQGYPRGQPGEPATQGDQSPLFAELTREEFQARHPTIHGHAEQSDNLSSNEQKQKEYKPWERGQHSPLTEEPFKAAENTRQPWGGTPPAWEVLRSGPYRNQALADSQREGGQVQQQPRAQRDFLPLVQQPQRQVREQREIQPTVQEKSQTAQQEQKQDKEREEKPEGQQARPPAGPPIPESVVVGRLPPITSSHIDTSHVTLPPIITPLVTAPSVLEDQTPAPARTQPLPTLEPDPNTQLSWSQLGESYATTPSVVGHAQRPFGIPSLTRDLFAGRPNHYDETTARWAQLARARRSSPDDDYDDDSDDSVSETGGGEGKGKEPAHAGTSSEKLPGRGRKRTFSQASSAVDSTLSAELDQPFTPAATTAVVPGTEALRRNLRDDATIAQVRREDGERAALYMAAAANTLQGGGRGLRGVTDAQVVANDWEIRRRQEGVDRQYSRRRPASVVVLKEARKMDRPGGDGGGGSGDGSGGSARGRGA